MKKVITILMILVLCFSFAVIASAEKTENGGWEKENSEQNSNNEELRAYIEEKIVPVVVGVITSVVALIGTLKSLFSVLKELKTAKSNFEKIAAQNTEDTKKESLALRKDYDAIKESIKDVPELLKVIEKQDTKIEELKGALIVTTEILSLAYSANSELVRTGKAKEMNRLLDKLGVKEMTESETV